jgi:catechol 2,3-dioxygenase-like lactoylglutathione lyase family enzyme
MVLFNGINVVSIPVPDLDRARDFARDVLSLGEPDYDLPEAGWIEFGTGSAAGNLAVTRAEPGWPPSSVGTTLVLNTADCHREDPQLGLRGSDNEVTRQAIDSMGGFTIVLAGLKALLEHGIELNFVADHVPDAPGSDS